MWIYIVGQNFQVGVRDDSKYQEGNMALQEFWEENCPEFLMNLPVFTLIGVVGLARKEILVEIMIIAATP
jgi:enamine deaminase RidA (YjgF/YER057c/UK114 family)